MKVAIWGSYSYGNYGDDLMALQFAETLKRMGVDSCVYRLDSALAERYSVKTTNSLEELFQGATFCIIGGGGMLVDKQVNQQIENDFRDLHLISSSQKCPVFPISVGGDGQGPTTQLSYWRREFWQGPACQTTTVRLKEDIAIVNSLGKEAIYYPDVLLSIGDFWDIEPLPKQSGQLRVGINLGNSLRHRFMAFLLSAIAPLRKDIVFYFIRSHLPNYTEINYELLPQESPYIKHHVYTADALGTLRFLKSLDLLVSSKLHIGLTALSLGTPFYSYRGPRKARSFLKTINADFAIWPEKETVKLVRFLTNPERVLEAKTKFDWAALENLKEASRGHITFLEKIVNSKR